MIELLSYCVSPKALCWSLSTLHAMMPAAIIFHLLIASLWAIVLLFIFKEIRVSSYTIVYRYLLSPFPCIMYMDLVWLTGVLQKRKWENCMTIDRRSWGFRRNAPISDYLSPDDIIATLVTTVRSVLFLCAWTACARPEIHKIPEIRRLSLIWNKHVHLK